MADAREMREWDRVAWTCFFIPRFGKKRFDIEDFHPLRGRDKTVKLGATLAWMRKMSEHLPEALSEEEKDRRWQEYVKDQAKKGQ